MLGILEGISARLESGAKVDPDHLEQILEFIRIFADKCHHGKEEDFLFPAMEKAGVPREGGPIGCMLSEHDMGRERVKRMTEAVTRYREGERSASSAIAENAKGYVGILRDHIHKENNVLFPMAEAHLNDREMEELQEAFEKVESERIGKGKHEEFHRLLSHLKEMYGK